MTGRTYGIVGHSEKCAIVCDCRSILIEAWKSTMAKLQAMYEESMGYSDLMVLETERVRERDQCRFLLSLWDMNLWNDDTSSLLNRFWWCGPV